MAWLDISNDLTALGRARVKTGQVLIFDYEGSPVYLKIMRKGGRKVWAKRLDPKLFLTPEEADNQIVIEQKRK